MQINAKWKNRGLDLLCDVVGSVLYALGLYTFARMGNFAPGGISGLSLILNHLIGVPIGLTALVLNVPVVILSYKLVGRRFILKSARTMLFSTFFLDVIFPRLPVYTGSPLLAALFAGIFCGAGMALFYIRGSSSGGTDFLTVSIKTMYPHLSIGMVTMSIDLAIILLGWPAFGHVDAVLYGLIMTFSCSFVIDKIMYGTGAGKLVLVITDRSKEVAHRIDEITGRGSTSVRAIGNYTDADRFVVLCACSRSQAYLVKRAAHEIDPASFVMLTETSEVYGEGFIENEDKK